jgi:hypothetical protein
MKIESDLNGKGVYITDCVDQEYIDKIFALEDKLNIIDQIHYFRSSFSDFDDNELSIYLTEKINDAIIEYINKTQKDINEYIAKGYFHLSNWKTGIELPPHIDTKINEEEQTHNPRPIINCLLYLTDDYDGGELIFPDINTSIKPKAGSVVVFDSDFMHGVNAVKSGTRKTLESHLYSIHSEDIEEIKSNKWRYIKPY